jgi:hypothetical protein
LKLALRGDEAREEREGERINLITSRDIAEGFRRSMKIEIHEKSDDVQ